MSNNIMPKIKEVFDESIMYVEAGVSTLSSSLSSLENRLIDEKAELLAAQEKLKQHSEITTEHLESLVKNQLKTIECVIEGITASTCLSRYIGSHLSKKMRQLTILTSAVGILCIAALVIAIVR